MGLYVALNFTQRNEVSYYEINQALLAVLIVETLKPVKIIIYWSNATPTHKSFGKPPSKKMPKIKGLRAAPRSIPE